MKSSIQQLRLKDYSVTRPNQASIAVVDGHADFIFQAYQNHADVTLLDGRILMVPGQISSWSTSVTFTFDPATRDLAYLPYRSYASYSHQATLLQDGKVLVSGGYISAATNQTSIFDPTTDTWSAGPVMATARYRHTATRLLDGKVLVAGGIGTGAGNSSEIYDPVTNTWSPGGALNVSRSSHTATLLPDGKVFVVNGSTSEIYDPAMGTWSPAAPVSPSRNNHTATLLADGSVLIAGGNTTPGGTETRYIPSSNTWVPVPSLKTRRSYHSASLLPDGRVLIAGGTGSTDKNPPSEIYDPATDTWTEIGRLDAARMSHTAIDLPGGKILIHAGKSTNTSGPIGADTRFEVIDPVTGVSLPLNEKHAPRYYAQFFPLEDGKVFVSGGSDSGSNGGYGLNTTASFDPETDSWTPLSKPVQVRAQAASIRLKDGRILYNMGWDGGSYPVYNDDLYDPETGTWATGPSVSVRYRHAISLLADDRVLISGGMGHSTLAQTNCMVRNPATGAWTNTGSLAVTRAEHIQLLLPDGKVIVIGGYSKPASTYTVLSSTEIYDPSAGTWSAGPSMPYARYGLASVELEPGKFLLVGGRTTTSAYTAVNTAMIFDASAMTFTPVAAMNEGRSRPALSLLPDGRALVSGGATGTTNVYRDSMEIYDPATDSWTPLAASLPGSRYLHAQTVLKDGRILIGGMTQLAQAYTPALLTSGHSADAVLSFYEPVQIEPLNCQAPYVYSLKQGTGTLYPSGKYVPNQYVPEKSEIAVKSADGCQATFTLETN